MILICFFNCLMAIPALSITYPPTFIEMPPGDKVFIPGEAIRLPCVANGSPSPKYFWYKNGQHFNWAANTGRYTKWPDHGTLVIARPGTDDDGMYQCVAKNQFGTALSIIVNVKRAELGDFESTKEQKVIVQLGQSVRLPCQVPVGFPPPVVTWQTEKNAQIHYLKETNRRATDINGYLYIATVIPEDDDTLYTCVANNEVLRIQKSGPSFRLSVRGQQSTYTLRTDYRSPRTEDAAVGDIVQLRCIYSGYPEPQYTWFKNESEKITLPNVKVKNMGTMLEINPVTIESDGEYRCQGTNEVTKNTVNSQFTVHVRENIRPKFIEKPEDITVPVNGSVTFRCTATGDPQPKIRWTINGEDPSSYLDGVRKVLHGNTMQLNNLTIKDSAVIQCNASNKFGYAFTNAYVNVMREAPYFMKPPESVVRAVDGNQVTLYCQTFSAPKAIISWTKDRRPINGGRYKILTTGDLFIESVAITDSGIYECTATNPFGSQKASGKLLVRRKTRIVLAPINTRVYENDVVKFVCTAETDPAEVSNLKITWYKDDNYIDPNLTPRIQQVWFDYALVLSGAQPRDTGQYRCNASNGLDYDTATAPLLVQGRPEQAINVQVNCVDFINEELALITWYPGSDNYAPIMEYIVEYSTQFERETWYPAEIFNLTGLVQSTSIKVVLRPNIQYQFRVRTRNRVGVSLPSQPTTRTCGIPGRVPSVNPKELYVFGTIGNNLVIRWTTLPFIEHNGNNLGYILTVQCLNCASVQPTAINTTVIGDWRTDRIVYTSFKAGVVVSEIESYKLFRVTIQSRNEKGVSTQAPTVALGYSSEAMTTVSPPAPTILNTSVQGVTLQLKVIEANQAADIKGFFRGYRIEWCDASLDEVKCSAKTQFKDVIFRVPSTPVLYTNRRRRSVNEIKETFNHASTTEGDIFHAFESVLERYLPASRKAYYKWLMQSSVLDAPNPICESTLKRNISCPGAGLFPRAVQSPSVLGDAYSMLLTRRPRQPLPLVRPSNDQSNEQEFTWGMNISYLLTGVPGATNIKLWVRILTNKYAGPISPIVELTTPVGLSGPVSNLKADAISVNYVDVSWSTPTEPNGYISGYELEAMELNGLDIGYGFRYPSITDNSSTSYRMSRLKGNTTYRITIWPITEAGLGVDNFIHIKTAPSDEVPSPPTFVITHVTETGFTIIYEPSHIGLPGTVFFVQYRQPGIVHWLESVRTFMNRTIIVDSLMSDTTYTVRMIATNGDALSTASEDRVIHTLGGPSPGSLAGDSGIWFIIVCTLLLFFVALLVLLILIRKRRLESVQKKANAPLMESHQSLVSPEYAQPEDPDAQLLYRHPEINYSAFSGSRHSLVYQMSRPTDPDRYESDEQWSPSESETIQNHRLRNRETDEYESEFERSPGPSDNEIGQDNYVRSRNIQQSPLVNTRTSSSRNSNVIRDNNNSSNRLYIKEDPTII
ncbi:hypothetical protein MN116_003061 [Schistosoma mekongi]|uniref:Neuroglian n=1 Tax=Schistosoma mekongi TaxID=38744 RepID=A0AAE1ZH30_SCHME|nr:hypothetical protein MN116_003061 [Schistosoma mekongi]